MTSKEGIIEAIDGQSGDYIVLSRDPTASFGLSESEESRKATLVGARALRSEIEPL